MTNNLMAVIVVNLCVTKDMLNYVNIRKTLHTSISCTILGIKTL